jgi:hypothetical protein
MVPCCHDSSLRPRPRGAWSTWSPIAGADRRPGRRARMVVRRFDGPRRAQLRGRSSWHLGARRTDCRTGHISPRDAGRLLSLGALLAPSVVAVALALVVTRPGAHPNGRTGAGAQVNGASSEASHGAAEEVSSTFRLVSPSTVLQASGSDTDRTASPVGHFRTSAGGSAIETPSHR